MVPEDHLHESVRAIATEKVEVRMDFIQHDHYFDLSVTAPILGQLEWLINQPDRVRPRCMLVTAVSGMGKSAMIAELKRRHPPIQSKKDGTTCHPLLVHEVVPPATPQKLLAGICLSANLPAYSTSIKDYQSFVRDQITALLVKLVILDEVQAFMHATGNAPQHCCDILKWLTNATQRPVVAFGTPEVLPIFSRDNQLKRRFRHRNIREWTLGPELQSFVKTVLMYLPLQEPWDPVMLTAGSLKQILKIAEGTTDGIIELLKEIASENLSEGKECIEARDLKKMG